MNIANKEACPVCSFNLYEELGIYPWEEDSASGEICPSCGIQFGYSDAAGGSDILRQKIYELWRKKWLNNDSKPLSEEQAKEVLSSFS